MSYKSLRTLQECVNHGAMFNVTCPGCRRQQWVAPYDLVSPFGRRTKAIRGYRTVAFAAAVLRCSRCRQKGMNIVISTTHRVPAGVPVPQFLNADDRERKRLIRAARG